MASLRAARSRLGPMRMILVECRTFSFCFRSSWGVVLACFWNLKLRVLGFGPRVLDAVWVDAGIVAVGSVAHNMSSLWVQTPCPMLHLNATH